MTIIYIILTSLVISGTITAIEYNHGWAKLYNKVARFVTLKTKYNLDLKIIPSTPNSLKHELKTFIEYFLISIAVLFLIVFGYDLGRIFTK